MAFLNLFKTNPCVNPCNADSFYSLHDSASQREARINFIQQYFQITSSIDIFSSYKAIDEKFRQLIAKSKFSSLIKNEELIYSSHFDKRVVLSGSSKGEEKRKIKHDREKETKLKKRSAQMAEISAIYEEDENLVDRKQEKNDFQNQIKKLYKEKQIKILKKQENVDSNSEKLNLIPLEKSNSKKIRLSEEANDKVKRKSRKKSNGKLPKLKKPPSTTDKLSKSIKKEESTSFIDQIEKIDKAKGISNCKNLKTSFKFTPTNKTICISKIPANDNSINSVKKSNSCLFNSYQLKPQGVKVPNRITPISKISSNAILNKPKNKVKELIEQFGDKFKKATSNITNNKKKVSPIRSSIEQRKKRISLAKKDSKRKSIKNVSHFVKDIVKEINKTSSNNLINTSNQAHKVVNAVKKNPLVVNHKIDCSKPLNKSNIANNSVIKTPNRQKITQTTFRINQLNKKINPDDLKYDSNRCKKLMEAAKKKIADERPKRIGSTSTVSSLDCSETSLSSLKQDHQQSFKSVNSTFDPAFKLDTKNALKKNTTFSIKANTTVQKQRLPAKAQLINLNQKTDIINSIKQKPLKNSKQINNNATIIISNKIKNQARKRSISADINLSKPKIENYGIEELGSCDETDDEDEPNKPVPEWAKDYNLIPRAVSQAKFNLNFTKLFKATANDKVELEKIFKEKKQRFFTRSSSAEWTFPPVWHTGGLNGEESFRKLSND